MICIYFILFHIIFLSAYYVKGVISCKEVNMDPNLMEEPVWYDDDMVGMMDTYHQKKQKEEKEKNDDSSKWEDNINLQEFQDFQAFKRLTLEKSSKLVEVHMAIPINSPPTQKK